MPDIRLQPPAAGAILNRRSWGVCVGRTTLSGGDTPNMSGPLPDSRDAGSVTPTGVRLRFALAVFLLMSGAGTRVAAAQGLVEAGDTIFVTDRNGVPTTGRFLRLSPGDLALLVGEQRRIIPRSNIGRIERRDSLWNGMLIGAVPSALVGMAAAGASCSPHCDRDVPLGGLVFGAMGAGIGALIDAGIHGYSIIDGPALSSPNARGAIIPVTLLADIWLRVRQGDTIEVATLSGRNVTGKFVRTSNASVILTVDGTPREIPSSEVRRVTRAGNRYRSGALWGGAIFGVTGLIAGASCSGGGCGNALFMGMVAGSAGALWGAAIGAAIPRHPVVYQSAVSSRVHAIPIVHPGRVGVAFAWRP